MGFPEKRVQGCFWHQGSHPTSFPLWVQAEGQSHFRSVCQEDTDGSPDNSPMLGDTSAQCCLCPQPAEPVPHLLLSGDAAAKGLPSHSSEQLLLCCGGIKNFLPLAPELQLRVLVHCEHLEVNNKTEV